MPKKLNYAKKFTVTNLVKNGDFTDGMNNWRGGVIVTGTANGIATIQSNGAMWDGLHSLFIPYKKPNNKIYLSFEACCPPELNCIGMNIFWKNGTPLQQWGVDVHSTTLSKFDVVNTLPADTTDINFSYQWRSSAMNLYTKIGNIFLIDLTDTFGDNPPTQKWLYNNVKYFDGSINIWLVDNQYYTDEQYKNMVKGGELSYA